MPALIVPGVKMFGGGGAFAKAGDAVAGGFGDTVAGGVVQAAEDDAADDVGRVGRGVGEQCGEVEVEPGIAVAKQEAVVEQMGGLGQRAAGAGLLLFAGAENAQGAGEGGVDGGEGGLDAVGGMAGEEEDFFHTEAAEFAQDPGEDGAVATGEQRFWGGGGEGAQAGAEAPDEDGGLANGGGGDSC
ncbi:MAG TPA: hypothetical protein VGH36_08335 [Acetobacteraceae bacterium]